jgi:hypothetical protein
MIRPLAMLLALGLVGSALVGAALHATGWLRWLDLLVAAAALGYLWRPTSRTTAAYLVSLALGCMILWLVGITVGATPWLTWVTFGHGIGFLFIGIVACFERFGAPAHASSDLA